LEGSSQTLTLGSPHCIDALKLYEPPIPQQALRPVNPANPVEESKYKSQYYRFEVICFDYEDVIFEANI